MVATRKRKSTRTPVKSKKAKADEEGSPRDEHAAAAEALKALSKGGDVVAEALVHDSVNNGVLFVK